MSRFNSLKYLTVFTLPTLAFVSFNSTGWLTYLPLIEAFLLIPILELFFEPDRKNWDKSEEQKRLNNRWFDVIVYIVLPVQLFMVGYFLFQMKTLPEDPVTILGRVSAMGLLCGVLGINVAHELGHRRNPVEHFMSKMLLLTSYYQHFFIEHNQGHHKKAATEEDPASARYNEVLYEFWFRSIIFSYLSAWKIEASRLRKVNASPWGLRNQMLRFQIIQLVFMAAIVGYGGWSLLLVYSAAAIMGILLLETVNYIEHYGLSREKKGDRYERVMPKHSWNSDHQVGRVMLFELSRHSDHHFQSSRKYQVLRHMELSPQMPTGYPGMMILACFPPIWFKLMNRRLNNFKKTLSLL